MLGSMAAPFHPVPDPPAGVPPAELVDVDGCRLAVADTGGDGPPLVLLHGFGGSLATWWSVLPRLAERHRVVAFDRPGFGDSPLPDDRAAWPDVLSEDGAAALTWALCDRLGLGRVGLVGHSAGGAVAAAAAVADPGRVDRLGLVAAAIGPRMDVPAVVGRLAGSPLVRSLAAAAHPHVAEPMLVAMAPQVWASPAAVHPAIQAANRRAVLGPVWGETVWEAAAHHQPSVLFDRLRTLRVPALVLTGDLDRVVPPEVAFALARQLPDAHLVVVRCAGHGPHEERPGEVLAALRPFLAGGGDA